MGDLHGGFLLGAGAVTHERQSPPERTISPAFAPFHGDEAIVAAARQRVGREPFVVLGRVRVNRPPTSTGPGLAPRSGGSSASVSVEVAPGLSACVRPRARGPLCWSTTGSRVPPCFSVDMRSLIAIAAGYAGLSTPCGGSAPDAAPDSAPDSPTYHRDIAPILASNCVDCHRAGGVAPLSLTTHEEVAPFAEWIAGVTADRSMPPSNLDNSGDCGTFVGARWLGEEDIAAIAAWAQAGAPAGTPTHEPPEAPPGWTLDRVDKTLVMPEPYTPSESVEDEYRCFIIDPELAEDAFVTGFEVRLGQPEMVHHMTLFALDSAEDEEGAAELDAADDAPGYPCFADAVVPSRWLVGTGPSDRGGPMPDGTGLPMGAGRKTVLQMHYNRHNGTFPDQTAIDLRLEPSVAHEAFVESVADTDLELAPGEPEVVETDTMALDDDFTMWGVWPHMHGLGTTLRVTVTHPGSDDEACIARVNHYAFHWQQFAFYERPIHVRAGDTLRITCTFDTTSRDTTTAWGLGTSDEMCIAFFYITEGPGDGED